MAKTFREHHLLQLLYSFELGKIPLDGHLSRYFRANTSLGSKDRKIIAETIYALIRWLSLVDALLEKKQKGPFRWEERCALLEHINWDAVKKDETLPLYAKVGFPESLFTLLVSDWGLEKAVEIATVSNSLAPTTIRANLGKITRDLLYERLCTRFSVEKTQSSSWGIHFHERINFHLLEEFKEGLFEVQDEASQLCADQLRLKPGDQLLDYCAGAGGKALACAHKLEGKGQIYLHDVRKSALIEAKKRCKRAGVENGQILSSDAPHKSRLKGKMDWVIVDAPCTGTGTLRRNPDLKWRFTLEGLEELVCLQRKLVQEALAFVKPGGYLLYATCSVLKAESEAQALYFEEQWGLDKVGSAFRSFPVEKGMDGFFSVIFQKKKKELSQS